MGARKITLHRLSAGRYQIGERPLALGRFGGQTWKVLPLDDAAQAWMDQAFPGEQPPEFDSRTDALRAVGALLASFPLTERPELSLSLERNPDDGSYLTADRRFLLTRSRGGWQINQRIENKWCWVSTVPSLRIAASQISLAAGPL
jgi:hypothetical protein